MTKRKGATHRRIPICPLEWMQNMSDNDVIIADLKKSIETWNFALCKEATQKAIDAKIPVTEIMDEGLGKGMEVIGDRFDAAEIFLPQVVAASKTMEVALKMLESLMGTGDGTAKGTVVMGTVEGDIHEIGKNVCCNYEIGRASCRERV